MSLSRRSLLLASGAAALLPRCARSDPEPEWAAPMRGVHARFTGQKGTFAQFGDSITVTHAFWGPLRYSHKNLDPAAAKAFEEVNAYLQPQCWDAWKGPEFGSEGG